MTTTEHPHYDVVVIGSGFGGSVVAYRMVEAGRSVCLLERGRAYPPGSFPRSPYRMKSNFWDPSEGYYGLYDVWATSTVAGVIASGLGGGSLIFANVLLRKDERSFVTEDPTQEGYEYWPVTRADLEPYYDRVEQIMTPRPYPIELPPYNGTRRALALRSAAESLRLNWFPPPLAVTFAAGNVPVPGVPIRESVPNIHGRPRETCRLCAECCFGCNYGSKNSLDLNYISLARRLDADVRILCEVREIRPRTDGGRGYLVRYVRHDLERAGRRTATHDPNVLPLRTLSADQVVLAAGTYGSTFLLMKNRFGLPGLSDRLGTKFCTNGDFLAFGGKCSRRQQGRRRPRVIEADFGTAITGAIRVPGPQGSTASLDSYLEDMGYPAFLSWLLQVADLPNTTSAVTRLLPRIIARRLDLGSAKNGDALNGDLATLFGSTELSAGLLPLIGVGRDRPDGRMRLENGRLELSWDEKGSSAYFERAQRMARAVVGALGGKFWDGRFGPFGYGVTMHPLGGCPMGLDASQGVVDAYGEVFNHPGLFVADGSVLPGPVGANPSLTIAAVADRTAERALEAKTVERRPSRARRPRKE
jgi:cholesterol oxidase